MATYYLSAQNGSDSNNGTSIATPKLTFAAVEALVAAGDLVWVEGGGTFRATWTTTTAGSSGNPITYVADMSGKVFGNGNVGHVRVTGSNDDQTRTRSYSLHYNTHAYRVFDGIHCDSTTSYAAFINASNAVLRRSFAECNQFVSGAINLSYCSNGLVDSCQVSAGYEGTAVRLDNNGGHTVRNCIMSASRGTAFAAVAQTGSTAENCLSCYATYGYNQTTGGSSLNVRNSLAYQCQIGFDAGAGSIFTATDCGASGGGTAFGANVVDGGGNVTYPIEFEDPGQLGVFIPILPWALRPDSPYASRAVATGPSVDFYGFPRPADAPPSWGPVQRQNRALFNANADPALATVTLQGESYYDFQVVIPGSATRSYTLNVEWTDNTNIGTKPRLELLDDSGDSLDTDDASGSGSTEALTVSGTNSLSFARVFRVRVYNRTTSYSVDPDLAVDISGPLVEA